MSIAVVCTMDTKGPEAEYLRERIQSGGQQALLLDVSTFGEPQGQPDISSDEIVARTGRTRAELISTGVRGEIVGAMAQGAALVMADLLADERITGAIGIGGNQGTAIAATAMRALPIGFPKFLVSTVASGNVRPFVGHKDIATMFSVSDFVGGLNVVSRSILANAAAAIVGMVENGRPIRSDPGARTVAVTALGNTERAAHHATRLLEADGFTVVAFHASGAGGSAMEELVSRGMIDAVLDLTLHEVTEEVMAVGAYVPVTPGRFLATCESGVPVVASTGGMEYLCFGPRSSIPAEMQDHVIYMHNPYNANVKISREELLLVANVLADRLNSCEKARLLIPKKAWSVYGSDGGPFHDPEGIRLFIDRLLQRIANPDQVQVLELSINDEAFAEACVKELKRALGDKINTAASAGQ